MAKNHFFVRIFFLIVAVLTVIALSLQGDELPEKPMVIIVPSYKNIQWYEQNLSSIFMQDYTNYTVVYVDDCSPDGTADAVENYVIAHQQESRFQLVRNLERVGAMANLYGAIHACQDHVIAVLLDGDDFLAHPNVLKQLNEVYSQGNIFFTHGTLKEYPWGHVAWCEPVPPEVIKNGTCRQFKCPSHLRTFYVWLFKKIRLQDFLYKGEFLKMAWDMAIMFPLVEMAEERHAFIKEVNYIYNMSNVINDNKVDPALQNALDKLIRNRPTYKRLQDADIPDYCK